MSGIVIDAAQRWDITFPNGTTFQIFSNDPEPPGYSIDSNQGLNIYNVDSSLNGTQLVCISIAPSMNNFSDLVTLEVGG